MKKFFTLAVVVTLCLTGTVFAQGRHYVAKPDASFGFGTIPAGGTVAAAAGPSTTNNNDSCDIGVTPAATLLLPYFEVETASRATDTFFTITNTSRFPQIAHVTVWTDWSFPVLDFNIFLTGYDVQPISMYDVIVNGSIAPLASGAIGGTSSATTPGTLSASNTSNPNFFTVGGTVSIGCTGLPGLIPGPTAAAVRSALISGNYSAAGFTASCSDPVGSPATSKPSTTTAVGYVTVDVANRCSTTLPVDPTYYTNEILFDNVLIGDYQILNKAAGSNYAGGNPMVHIQAIPEGGRAGLLAGAQTNLPYTFYSRYANTATSTATTMNADRRQPLPAVFGARWIEGGASGFNTSYRIWREGVTGGGVSATGQADCTTASDNAALPIREIIRFDEHEQGNTFNPGVVISPAVPASVTLPETSTSSTATGAPVGMQYPPNSFTSKDAGGWMYMNLDTGLAPTAANLGLHPTFPTPRASQNWVVVSMTGSGSTAGLFGVDFDAAWLGNGCSAPVGLSTANGGTSVPGPVGGVFVCPQGATNCPGTSTLYTGTNVTP